MKRLINAALLLFALAMTASAQSTTTVSHTFYRPDGAPDTRARVLLYEVVQNENVITRTPVVYRTDSLGRLLHTDGTVGAKILRNSIARLYINAAGFSDTATGVWYVIPDSATANLASLERWATGTYYLTSSTSTGFTLRAPNLTSGNAMTFIVPNSLFTGNLLRMQKANGTVVFNIDANGNMTIGNAVPNINALTEDTTPDGAADFVMTYDASAGTHKKVKLNNLPGGGGGSLTVREVDASPSIASVSTVEFLQSSGFVVTDQTGGVVRIDLAAIPYAKLNLSGSIVNADVAAGIDAAKLADGSISNAEFQRLNGVSSDIQTQLDGKAASGHNHNGVYEPADADLSAIAGLSATNDDIIQRKAGAWTNRTMAQLKTDLALVKGDVGLGNVTNDAQLKIASNLSDLNNAATARTNLGVAIGSDVQAFNAILADLAGLTQAADKGIYFDSSTTAATFDLTTFGRSLIDDANAGAARTTLGLVIGTDVLAPNGSGASLTSLNADNISAGTLAAARGGAGTVNGILKANGSGVVSAVTVGSGLSFDGTTLSASGGSGASTALDNLASVAINTSLISDTDNTDDLGTSAIRWKNLYLSGFIGDGSGNEILKVGSVASAVNEVTVTNAATGNNPEIAATGGDTNIGLTIAGKGTGKIRFPGNIYFTQDKGMMAEDNPGDGGIRTVVYYQGSTANYFFGDIGGGVFAIKSGILSGITTLSHNNFRLGTNDDTGFSKAAAGVVEINNGTAGQSGVFLLRGRTVANLPGSPVAGMETTVTDSTTQTWGDTVAGGGSFTVRVWYNGSAWTVIGK